MLYGAVSQHTEYILTATASKDVSLDELKEINPIFIGTRESNQYINSLTNDGTVELIKQKEGVQRQGNTECF